MKKISIFFAVALFATIGFSSCENNSLKRHRGNQKYKGMSM